ncbi:hypothetical protein D5086_032199 [Populus alba]|uniref:Uncharacterized protein n=3 Tax=Populus TaxID=3689 RepID=A0ACC4ALL5_POPAL|nr:hypothetical protein NC653_039903 [Populus alba x Populus x berolinensis]
MALSPVMMAYDTGPDPVLSNHDLRLVVLHANMKDSETKMFWPTVVALGPFPESPTNFLVFFANSIGVDAGMHPDFNHGEHAPWMIFNHFPNWSGQVSRPPVCIVKYRADWTSRRLNRKSTAPTTRIIASKANAQVTQRPT